MKIVRILALLLLSGGVGAYAQSDFPMPQGVKLKVAEDYTKYEKDIVAAANWLEDTPLDKYAAKRQEVNAFVMQWISGSPDITITLYGILPKLADKNPDLLMVYMSSYAKYCIEHKDEKESLPPSRAALKSMMNVYKKGIGIKKNKEMDKLVKANDSGKLDDYIGANFKE